VRTFRPVHRKEALEMLNDLAVKKLKIESEDQLNNNAVETEEEKRNSSSDSGSSQEDISSTLKRRRRDKRFDSTENLSNLQLSGW